MKNKNLSFMQKAKSVVHCGRFSKAVAQEKLSIHEDLEEKKQTSTTTRLPLHMYEEQGLASSHQVLHF
jgi:hypothetical protein